jgi:hypothetical protein
MFCYALLVQDGLHASALTAGLGLAPMAVVFLLASLSTSRLLARYGPKVLTAGGLLQALGLIVLAVTVWQGWPHLAVIDLSPGLMVAGFGEGLLMSPLFGVVLSQSAGLRLVSHNSWSDQALIAVPALRSRSPAPRARSRPKPGPPGTATPSSAEADTSAVRALVPAGTGRKAVTCSEQAGAAPCLAVTPTRCGQQGAGPGSPRRTGRN